MQKFKIIQKEDGRGGPTPVPFGAAKTRGGGRGKKGEKEGKKTKTASHIEP